MKPIIGITPDYDYSADRYSIHEDYIFSIEKAGGSPILIFPSSGLPPFIDGLLLSGGGDVDPLIFGEEPVRESGNISPLRDSFEIALTKEAIKNDLPILGICRGMQVMNIAAGGDIYQDIALQTESPIKHSQQAPRNYGTHSLRIRHDTLLFELLGKAECTVNSFHHQAVKNLGEGFFASAHSKDAMAEAIEHRKCSFALGIQWHPEAMKNQDQYNLFSAFVNAAAQFKHNRR